MRVKTYSATSTNRSSYNYLQVVLVCVASLLLLACNVPPTHPSLKNADLPPLVPVRAFTANIDYAGGYRVSPDGEKLLWSGVSRL